MFQCKFCAVPFNSIYKLKKHLQESHKELSSNEKSKHYKDVLIYIKANLKKIRKEKKKDLVQKKQKFDAVANEIIAMKQPSNKVVTQKKIIEKKRKIKIIYSAFETNRSKH